MMFVRGNHDNDNWHGNRKLHPLSLYTTGIHYSDYMVGTEIYVVVLDSNMAEDATQLKWFKSKMIWAKVWNVKREATPSTLYEEAEKEQTKIRSQQWEKLNAKNDARHLQAEKRHAEQAARSADDRETGIVTSLLKEILLKTTDRVVLEIVHDALDLEPPEMEEEKEESKVDQQVNKKLKRKKSSYKSKQRKKLGDIIK